MSIDMERYEKLLNSGWVIDTLEDSGEVPDEAGFTIVLKEGAPEHIRKEYQEWKELYDWIEDSRKNGRIIKI